ncbi:hypothetical protein [Kitasatospora acidiphila]|uniref:hypothetical protein n=1 Tax=Kitasatospora acidiphila TaxID=2567942 RepID=UPI003C726C87
MAPARRITPLIAAALVAIGVFTAGCATSTGPRATGPALPSAAVPTTLAPMPRPAIGEIPVVDSTDDKTMPVDAYLFTTEQRGQVDTARGTLVAQCMKRFGLTYTLQPESGGAPRTQATHRYNVADPSNGYRPAEPAPARPSPTPMPPDMVNVLTGARPGSSPSSATYHGIPIPKGGCLGEADARLTAQGGSIGDSPLATSINFDLYRQSMTDDRLTTVFRKWSDCMRTKGFSYPTPNDAGNDPRWKTGGATPSPQEVAAATADSTCRQQTNVIGTWFTVESAYETEAIQAHQQELAKVRQGIAAVVKSADVVNSGGTL